MCAGGSAFVCSLFVSVSEGLCVRVSVCLCVCVSVCVSVHLCVYACTKTGDTVKLSGEREQNDRRTTEQKAT